MNGILKKGLRYFISRDYRFLVNANLGMYNGMSDEEYLRNEFRIVTGYPLDLDNPKTFNEKLQWLKLHDRKPIYTTMVDKFEAKRYVAGIVGDECIIPTYGVWDHFNDIVFSELPCKFVLKCTHDSGGLVIVKDKETLNMKKAKSKIDKSLKRNYFWQGREWPYKDVKPRILAEKYLEDESGELRDYKLLCFHGKVRCSFTCTERFSQAGLKVTFFDNDWNVMPFERHYPKSAVPIPKPANFDKMIEMAEKLSRGIPFVRVDFYEVKGQVYFGELTFYPGDGMEEFIPVEWDYKLGEWIKLPLRDNENGE